MKSFIIDDEPKIRRGLANIVSHYRPDWPVPLTASNAEEALKNPGLMETDILFLDIQLPGMNGLDLLQLLKPQSKKGLQVIVISGYADFAYAQQSIRLCAKDYLLKPVDIHKLHQILDDVEKDAQDVQNQKRDLQLINSNLHNLRRDFFSSVISGTCQFSIEEYKNYMQALELNDSAYAVLLFQTDYMGSGVKTEADAKYSFNNNLKAVLSKDLDYYITETFNAITAIFIWKYYNNEKALSDISVAQETALDHSCKTVASAIHFSFFDLSVAYQEALQGLQNFRCESDPAIFARDQTNYVETIVKKCASYHPVVQETIQYVMQYYASPIKVEQIASMVFVHSNYLSDLFKRETGGNLSTFISDFRLYQAKKKLWRLENKVFMISEQVGFTDQHYFSQVFKKRVGISPQRYRSLSFGVNREFY